MVDEKKITRDLDALFAAEKIYNNYNEMLVVGFTPDEALTYLATLIGYMALHNKKVK